MVNNDANIVFLFIKFFYIIYINYRSLIILILCLTKFQENLMTLQLIDKTWVFDESLWFSIFLNEATTEYV